MSSNHLTVCLTKPSRSGRAFFSAGLSAEAVDGEPVDLEVPDFEVVDLVVVDLDAVVAVVDAGFFWPGTGMYRTVPERRPSSFRRGFAARMSASVTP